MLQRLTFLNGLRRARKAPLAAALVWALVASAGAWQAVASPRAQYQTQIKQFQEMLQEQEGQDHRKVAATDIALTRQWLEQAEVLLAHGDQDAAARRLRLAEKSLDLVRALVVAAVIDIAAEKQEIAAQKAQGQLQELTDQLGQLARREAELKDELARRSP